MDSSWRPKQEGPRTCARLVDSKEANRQYVFTYTLENAEEAADGGGQVAAAGAAAEAAAERRTVFSAVGMGFNGR